MPAREARALGRRRRLKERRLEERRLTERRLS
jgi:hypothetical protein